MLSSLLARRTGTSTPRQTGLRILLVDDSDAFLEAATPYLESLAVVGAVELARSADEAIVFAAHYRPDVVLMDYEMPGSTGIDALRKIKARSPELRIVIMTLHEPSILARKALSAGADGLVPKDEFRDRVPEVLARLFGRGVPGCA